MDDRDRKRIRRIRKEIRFCEKAIEGTSEEDFSWDDTRQHAIAMALTIIGETVKKISYQTKERHPAVPWKDIAGLRDIAVHTYDELDMPSIYETATKDLPELDAMLAGIQRSDKTEQEGQIPFWE